MRITVTILFALGLFSVGPAYSAERMICQFKGVGEKQFQRLAGDTAFTDDRDTRFSVVETERFLQLRTAEIDPDYVTNPFTVYLIDKDTKRIRQISGAMRAAPMMADGVCAFTSD